MHMQSKAITVNEYIDQLPGDRKEAINKLRKIILDNLPQGFVETMNYGMIGYVVPHSIYPDGYHCNPELPLAFINIASQKNFVAVYHMASMQIRNYPIGSLLNIPNIQSKNWIWAKAVFALKKLN